MKSCCSDLFPLLCSLKHSPRSSCKRKIVKYYQSTIRKHAQKFVVIYEYPSGHHRAIIEGQNNVFSAKSKIVLKQVLFPHTHLCQKFIVLAIKCGHSAGLRNNYNSSLLLTHLQVFDNSSLRAHAQTRVF